MWGFTSRKEKTHRGRFSWVGVLGSPREGVLSAKIGLCEGNFELGRGYGIKGWRGKSTTSKKIPVNSQIARGIMTFKSALDMSKYSGQLNLVKNAGQI